MAELIVENREFKDRETSITTAYKYYAIKGGKSGKEYEVPLKSLTGAEKMALEMIADMENVSGSVETRKANNEEVSVFQDKNNEDDKLNIFDEED